MNDELPLLDQRVLDDLRASVGEDDAFVADLAATYLAEGAEHVAMVAAAAAAGDTEAIVRPAHSLKSSSAALGAARMAQLSRDIEHGGREGRIDSAVEGIRSTWDQTIAELRSRGILA